MIDLGRYKTLIVVWHMQGCGACEEFIPRVLKQAEAYKSCLGVLVAPNDRAAHIQTPAAILFLDANNPKYTKWAEQYKIESTPTTYVMFRKQQHRNRKIVGAVDDREIVGFLNHAMIGLSCEV